MKTKNLFFATALVASFASCTNDDIVEVQQGIANVERPTVENVKLNFVGEGADSRLVYNGEYAWQSTDKIGALLMSNPRTTATTSSDAWFKSYELVDYISTSYPFAYDTEAKVWGNDAKMLEGDYFFAHPWSAYEGERYLKHSLKNQTQTGVSGKVVAKDFADNQFFVGYSQIKKGTAAVDALTNVAMTPVLGGIQFRIINDGSKTYHLNKIVVKGEGVATELTLDPTSGTGFNYANYVGNKKSDLYTADEIENYDRSEYLRSFVVPVSGTADIAQLNIKGTKAERAIAKGKTGYAVVMLNEFTAVEDELTATIYTDEGVIVDINLTDQIKEYTYNGEFASYVLVDKEVEEVAFTEVNTVSVKFKDEAITTLLSADVYDNDDLLHLIEWTAESDIKVEPVATLKADDVELTAEMFNMLKNNANVTLTINGTDDLTLAAGVPADVLSYKGLIINTPVVVANEIELTEKTLDIYETLSMTIAEEGVVTIEEMGAIIPATIVNEGEINVGEEAIVVFNSLTNEGVINIEEGADVKGNNAIENNATINNNGYLEEVNNNAYATINMGEEAILKVLVNKANAVVKSANASYIEGSNAGLINFVTGATIDVTGAGMVSAEAPVTVTKDMYKNTCINTLTLKAGQTTTIADGQTGGINNIITAEGATLKVATDKTLALSNLLVNEKATIMGNITAANMVIAKNVKAYNYGNVVVTTSWSNKGIVYNNGYIQLPSAETAATWGVFKYTLPNITPAQTPAAQIDALELAIAEYINNPTTAYTTTDGYSVVLASLNTHLAAVPTHSIHIAEYPKAYAYGVAYGTQVSASDMATALANVLSDNKAEFIKALELGTFVNSALDFDDITNGKTAKEQAIAKFKEAITKHEAQIVVTGATFSTEVIRAAVNALTDTEVLAYIDGNQVFVYDNCNLEKAIAVWKKYDKVGVYTAMDYNKVNFADGNTTTIGTMFEEWAKEALKNSAKFAEVVTDLNAAGVKLSTVVSFGEYTDSQYNLCNAEAFN